MPRAFWVIQDPQTFFTSHPGPPSYGFKERFNEKAGLLRPGDILVDQLTSKRKKGHTMYGGFVGVLRVSVWDGGEVLRYLDLPGTLSQWPYRVRVEYLFKAANPDQMVKYDQGMRNRLGVCRYNPTDPSSRIKPPGWTQGKTLIELRTKDLRTILHALETRSGQRIPL